MDALQSCPEMAVGQEGDGGSLVEAWNAFIRESLLPAVNRQGKNGWSAPPHVLHLQV